MEEYYRRVVASAKHFLDVKSIKVFFLKKTFCSFRLYLTETMFIDVYHSSSSGRKDFFLIAERKRMFGYDNLGGWHRHPVEDPNAHELCEEVSEETVFEEMKRIVERTNIL